MGSIFKVTSGIKYLTGILPKSQQTKSHQLKSHQPKSHQPKSQQPKSQQPKYIYIYIKNI